MTERRYSRYTRERTWLALVNQIDNTDYALVPYSRTTNGVSLVRIKSGEESRPQLQKILDAYAQEMERWQAGERAEEPLLKRESVEAVILARSSDYYHYHLAEFATAVRLIICGLHDAYCLLPVLEMRTNKRYKARETSLDMQSPEFERLRKTEYGHNILITSAAKGDQAAMAFINNLKVISTKNRLKREVRELQTKVYRGRPLAFMNDQERRELGMKISEGMKEHHAKRKG